MPSTDVVTRQRPNRTGGRARLRRRPRRRTVLLAAPAAVLLIAASITGGVLWHLSAEYQPLRVAGWFGPQPGRPLHAGLTEDHTAYKIVGPAGTTQEFEWGLVNDGPHPITVTEIEPTPTVLPAPDPVLSVGWAPYRNWPGGLLNGHATRSRPFPAHLSAHGVIKVRFTVRKPANCPATDDGTDFGISAVLRVHWHAMISSHTTAVNAAPSDIRIILCGG